jgi:hypothetical protein
MGDFNGQRIPTRRATERVNAKVEAGPSLDDKGNRLKHSRYFLGRHARYRAEVVGAVAVTWGIGCTSSIAHVELNGNLLTLQSTIHT